MAVLNKLLHSFCMTTLTTTTNPPTAAPAAAVPAVETVDTTSDLSPAAVSPQGSVPTQNSVVTPVAQVHTE